MLTIRRVSLADKATFTDEDIQIDGQTHIPNSSVFRRGIMDFLSSGDRENRRSKSPEVKCFEQTAAVFPGFQFFLFCATKFTHLFLLFRASGLSSSPKGMKCSATPSSRLGLFEQPKTTHLLGMFSETRIPFLIAQI